MSLFSGWHRRWVGTGVGERTQDFLRGLRWTVPSALAARVTAGVASVLTARYLGPADFGAANLALAATLWVQVPLFLGVPTALMHFTPAAKPEDRAAWAANGLKILAIAGAVTLMGAYAWGESLAAWHGVSRQVFLWALVWCAGFWVYTTAGALLSARENFRDRGLSETLFALLLPATLFFLWRAGRLGPGGYVGAMAAAYALAGAWGFFRAWPGRAPWSGPRARALLAYGAVASGGGVAAALLQAMGKLVANRHLPLEEVGLLSAYMAGSVQMAVNFLGPATGVLFPIASRTPDKAALLDKAKRLLLPGLFLAFFFFAGVLWAYFSVLGRRYPLEPAAWAVFAAASALALAQGTLVWLLAAGGRRGIWASVAVNLWSGGVNAAANAVLIPRWGLLGAGAALCLAYAAGLLSAGLPWVKRAETA